MHHMIATQKVSFDRRLGVYGIYMTTSAFDPPTYHILIYLYLYIPRYHKNEQALTTLNLPHLPCLAIHESQSQSIMHS